MQRNAVGWFEIYVTDLARAQKFYETVFSIKLESLSMPEGSEGMEMVLFPMDESAPGAAGALVRMEGGTPSASGTLVYFSSLDCSIEEARVAEAGGKVIATKESIGEYGFVSVVEDTEGNRIGIHSVR